MARSVSVARTITRQGSRVAHLVLDDGQAHSLHFTPESVGVAGLGWTYATIERQGLQPLVRRDSRQAQVVTFDHVMGPLNPKDGDGGPTLDAAIKNLRAMVNLGRKVRAINMPDLTSGWYFPSLQVTVDSLDAGQRSKTATLSWTLTEAIDDRPKIAKVPPPPPPKPKPVVPKTQPDYRVVKGDCLWSIAYRFLGAGTRWKEIYTLNQKRLNLAAPVMYAGLLTVWIYPGQVLHIPAR